MFYYLILLLTCYLIIYYFFIFSTFLYLCFVGDDVECILITDDPIERSSVRCHELATAYRHSDWFMRSAQMELMAGCLLQTVAGLSMSLCYRIDEQLSLVFDQYHNKGQQLTLADPPEELSYPAGPFRQVFPYCHH